MGRSVGVMPAVGLVPTPPPLHRRPAAEKSSGAMILDQQHLQRLTSPHVHTSSRREDASMAQKTEPPYNDLIWGDERFNTLKKSLSNPTPPNKQQTTPRPTHPSTAGYQTSNKIRLGSHAPTSTTTSTVTARSNGTMYRAQPTPASQTPHTGSIIDDAYNKHRPVIRQPPRSLDLPNGYNYQPSKLATQKLSQSYNSGCRDRTDQNRHLASKHLSYSYDSTLITRALEANRSPDNSANSSPIKSPVKSPVRNNTSTSVPRSNGVLPRSLTSQDLQVHHARQVFIRNRSHSTDQSIYQNTSPLASPSSNSFHNEPQNGHHSPPSTPSTPSSSYSDPPLSGSTLTRKPGILKNNLRTISENINTLFRPLKASGKTKSEGDLLKRASSTPDHLDELDETESDDGGNDDYGFLSYPSFRSLHNAVSSSSSAMQKSSVMASSGATASPGSKLLPRRWRGKNKGPSNKNSSASAWKPEVRVTVVDFSCLLLQTQILLYTTEIWTYEAY